MNIDFDARPGFSIYLLLLMFSGIVMLGLTTVRSKTGVRVLNGLFGVGFVGYGFYLAFLFDGGTYVIFFKAFILPIVMAFQTIKARVEAAKQATAAPSAPAGAMAAPAVAPVADPAV